MRIGVFHPPMHPRYFGGSIAVTIPIVNELAENGYEVILFVRDRPSQKSVMDMFGEKISPSVNVILKREFLEPRGFLDLYECSFKLLTLKMKCDITIDTFSNYIFPWTDICYIHFPYINTYMFKERFPYIKSKRGLFTNVINLPYVFFAKNIQNYNRKLILANSRFTAKAIEETVKAKAKVLYPLISSIFLYDENVDLEKRENLVVTIGRITEDKRIETIPEIASLIQDKDINFVIAGFAQNRKVIRKINAKIRSLNLENKINIVMDAPKEKIKRILEKAKVYLHPPIIEHFGISIAEAMAVGCIPVTCDLGGVKEFVPEEFRYKSLQDAAEKVKKAINQWSPRYAKRLKHIVQKFSESNFRKNFNRMFTEYLSQKELTSIAS